MSFLPINEENKEAPTGQTTNAPATAPPQVSGSAGGAPSAPKGATTGSPTQFGSSASKLGDYLSANAPQITQQANTLAGNLNQQYGNVSQGITNAANQFGQQVQGGYAAPNQDVINQAVQNPAAFAATPENIKSFQSQYNDAYTGPLTFEGSSPYSDIQNQVGQAVQQGNLLGTQAGLQSYLQGQGTNPTQASSTLDALLLQGNPEAQATIQNAAKQLGTLPGQLQTATTGANQSVIDAQNAAQAAQAYAQGQFNPVVQKFGTSLADQLAATNANRDVYNQNVTQNQTAAQQYQQQLLAALASARGPSNTGTAATDAAAQALVKSFYEPEAQAKLAGLGPYLSGQPITQPGTLANVATAPQYAEDAALAALLGQGYTPLLNQANVGQAGTYSVPQIPGTVQNPSGEIQYIGDISSLYSNPGIANIGDIYGRTPAQFAQQAIQHGPGQGWNVDAAQQAALQRLVANQYAGR